MRLPLTLLLALTCSATWAAAIPSNEELFDIIQAQQSQIERLSKGREAGKNKAHLGGYGELHYNHLSAEDSARDLDQIDFHRFVLFLGYEFSDHIRLYSELEVEHSIAGEGQNGEVELEQAYLEFDLAEGRSARGGLFLLPLGILNETHEPPSFYGVERNDVESIIIPATWWAGGAAISQRWNNGLSFDFAAHEGLAVPTAGGNAFRIRSGRQKTSEADASELAYTARLKYTGVAGLELASSIQYQTDISQIDGDGLDSAVLYTGHIVLNQGMFGLKALYGRWELSGTAVESANVDTQSGWYIEPSLRPNDLWGVYARYEDLDAARTQDRFKQWELGVNFWPHDQVVVKLDVRSREHDLVGDQGRDFDGFDLGIGYHF